MHAILKMSIPDTGDPDFQRNEKMICKRALAFLWSINFMMGIRHFRSEMIDCDLQINLRTAGGIGGAFFIFS